MPKVFTEKQVSISALLGGPIPPGLLIYKNYKSLGKDKEAYVAIGSTLIFTIAFFYAMMLIPESVLDEVPNFVFSALYGLLVFLFFRYFMAREITEAVNSGAETGSNWTVAGLTFLGLVISVVILFTLAIQKPYYEGEVVTIDGNQLYYDAQIADTDVKKFSDQLQSSDFFGKDYGNTARLQLIGDEYWITVLVDKEYWNDPVLITLFSGMKSSMEVEFGKPTKLQFESASMSGKSAYKDL